MNRLSLVSELPAGHTLGVFISHALVSNLSLGGTSTYDAW